MTDPLGLSAAEESLYLLLVDAPSLTLSELADVSGASEQSVSVVLSRLLEQGLVTPMAGTPLRYSAIDPRVGLKGLLADQEQRLRHAEAAASQLAARFDRARRGRNPLDVVEVAVGAQPITERFMEMQRQARSEIIGMDRPPYVQEGANEDEAGHLTRGVRYLTLYDTSCLHEPHTLEEIRGHQRDGEQARVLDGVPFKLVVADRELALLTLTGGAETMHSCLLVHPSTLLDGLIATFETLWRVSRPLPPPDAAAHSPADAPAEGEPSSVERELLTLVGLGLTDKAVARQLQLSERTVQRLVSGVMERLSARTRFQAGVRARERGWV